MSIQQKVWNERALFAFQAVNEAGKNLGKTEKQNFRSYIKRMPAMIQVNGLGQTIAFYYDKANSSGTNQKATNHTAYKEILIIMYKRFKTQFPQQFENTDAKSDKKKNNNVSDDQKMKGLIKVIVNLDSETYRRFTQETLALLNWLRRFVDGTMQLQEESNL